MKKSLLNFTSIISDDILHGLNLGYGVEDVEGAYVKLMLVTHNKYLALKCRKTRHKRNKSTEKSFDKICRTSRWSTV
jgi:hypothetical protein